MRFILLSSCAISTVVGHLPCGLISALPNGQKEVVYLKFFQELSRDQIDQIMDTAPQTVSNLLQLAIR